MAQTTDQYRFSKRRQEGDTLPTYAEGLQWFYQAGDEELLARLVAHFSLQWQWPVMAHRAVSPSLQETPPRSSQTLRDGHQNTQGGKGHGTGN